MPRFFAIPTTIPGEEVAYLHYADPTNPFGATSPLQAIANAVAADEALQCSRAEFYRNGMSPSFAVIAGDITGLDEKAPAAVGQPPAEADLRRQVALPICIPIPTAAEHA